MKQIRNKSAGGTIEVCVKEEINIRRQNKVNLNSLCLWDLDLNERY